MSQTLVVDETNVDVGLELLAGDTRVHWLVAVVVVSGSLELLAEVVDWTIGIRESGHQLCTRIHGRECDIAYLKGVASWARPCRAPAFPAILSTNIPIVIRDGKACGLMMTSGCMPVSEKGMSIIGNFCEQTPF